MFQWSRTNFLEGSSNVLSSFPDLFCTSHCWNYPDKYWGRICLCQLAADFLTVVAQRITLVYMLRIFRFFNMFTWGFVSPAQILCLYKSLLCQNIHCLLYQHFVICSKQLACRFCENPTLTSRKNISLFHKKFPDEFTFGPNLLKQTWEVQ